MGLWGETHTGEAGRGGRGRKDKQGEGKSIVEDKLRNLGDK